ncbi:hypothetical protein DM01DRAFT_313727 [Hesseltinella vesiculosa]|uniref:CCZ1/INTU/HSP4 first Longin domain-containing protein n=1 Tax=Hesseltinella vesiculosa TaxID=101127 RepID=A0A1X2G5V2_9FUNG|nr:hypothetical protein DM01DRAFT_313727 [Hesseltinella vesiculosa]
MAIHDTTLIDNGSDAPSLGLTPPVLSYFCVYNPCLSQSEENTKDQILYYTANKVIPADVKMKQVGLAQALVSVASTFSSQPTQNVHSQKNRMVFLQPEPGFWFHMCVELGIHRRQIKDPKGNEKLVTEYLDTELNDHALSGLLQVAYEQFKLLNGTMTWMLYEDDPQDTMPNRQRIRSLMHAIEEFFSSWIWKWDFARLDTLLFGTVFNSVPTQSIHRANYLRLQAVDQRIHQQYPLLHHCLVLDDKGSLIYHSPSLQLLDVRSLRKYILKRWDAYLLEEKKRCQRTMEKQALEKKEKASTYFSKPSQSAPVSSAASIESTTSHTTTLPDLPTNESTSPSPFPDPAHDGEFLTGMIQDLVQDMNGEERTVVKQDIVRVYLDTSSESQPACMDALTEYILIIYKDPGNFLWSFLLPSTNEAQETLGDIDFYTGLEQLVCQPDTRSLMTMISQDVKNMKKKTMAVSKHYKCFYYDHASLDLKSTAVDSQGHVTMHTMSAYGCPRPFVDPPFPNDILLQLLQVKLDFEVSNPCGPGTEEVYTRSTTNHWIIGKRIYHQQPPIASKEYSTPDSDDPPGDDHQAPPDDSPRQDSFHTSTLDAGSDFSEIYLVAAKKDITMADIEDNIQKIIRSLLDVLHTD